MYYMELIDEESKNFSFFLNFTLIFIRWAVFH